MPRTHDPRNHTNNTKTSLLKIDIIRTVNLGHLKSACSLVLVLTALLLPTDLLRSASSEIQIKLKQVEQVDTLFTPWNKGETPGAAVIVIKDGKIILKKGYGLAEVGSKKPITPDTAFLLASITKQFTAMAIMMLAERGKISYEDPLSNFFPEFPPYAQKITVRHLLNHTAGFAEYDDLFVEARVVDHDWPRSSNTKPSKFEPTSKDALKLLAQQQTLRFSPGEKFEYSNSGYVILAQIVEKVSGKRFAEFLKANIFDPLGMKRTLLTDERRQKVTNVASSYQLKNGSYDQIDYTPLNAIYGEDNIYSTVEDLYKWDQALYTQRLVKASTLNNAFTPGRLNDGSATSYGFGWRIRKFLGLDTVSHSGSWLGFNNYLVRFPSERFTLIVLSNLAQFQPTKIASKIAKIYLSDKLTFPVAIPLNPNVARAYVGKYEFAPGAIAEITLENNVLWIKPPGDEKTKLLASAPDVLFLDGMEEISLILQRDAAGKVVGFMAEGRGSARRLP